MRKGCSDPHCLRHECLRSRVEMRRIKAGRSARPIGHLLREMFPQLLPVAYRSITGNRGMIIYALQDLRRREFGSLMQFMTEEEAVRGVYQALSQESMLSKYPRDFDLFRLGVFDLDTGTLVPEETPRFVVNVATLAAQLEAMRKGESDGR